jgi:hypothetical protein
MPLTSLYAILGREMAAPKHGWNNKCQTIDFAGSAFDIYMPLVIPWCVVPNVFCSPVLKEERNQ